MGFIVNCSSDFDSFRHSACGASPSQPQDLPEPAASHQFSPQSLARYCAQDIGEKYFQRSNQSFQMEAVDNGADYINQSNHGNFATSQTPQLYNPFNSPSITQRTDIDIKHSPDSHLANKRKRSDLEHSNSPVHSNPDLDSYIKSKRKPREKKACQVCRKRKVGCDQQQPCQNCIERRYPELCVYENQSDLVPHRSDTITSQSIEHSRHASLLTPVENAIGISPEVQAGPDMITIPRDSFERLLAKLDQFQRSSSDLNSEIRNLINSGSGTGADSGTNHPTPFSGQAMSTGLVTAEPNLITTDGIHTRNELTGQTVHVGGNSVPAFVMTYGSHLEDLLGTSVLPAFGLENESATYPFVSLSDLKQGRLSRVVDLCKTLPPEADIDRYVSSFRDISGVVYPAMANIDKFENELLQFHITRTEALSQSASTGIDEQGAYGRGLAWIGLLFATLASGCQCADFAAKELDLASRVFVCCSFECLRLTNFLSNPSLENVQTLLILGNVISNTMNAGVAWALLGMTTRLAQVLGLHRPCREDAPQETKNERNKIAWTTMWQESLLSITFDRAPASTNMFCSDTTQLPHDSYAADGSWSFSGCMYQVTKVGLELIQERRKSRGSLETLSRMSKYEQDLRNIMRGAAAHLKSSQHCVSLREQLQYWALYLHTSYIMSEVCREAIKPKIPQSDLAQSMKVTCLESLTNTVKAFLGLNRLTSFASHSWSALSRGLSSALVLGILGHGEKNEEVHSLLSQLLMLLQDVMARNSDGAEIAAPIQRWIATLTKLTSGNNSRHGSSSGTSPMLELDSDDSPYAQADHIIWGSSV